MSEASSKELDANWTVSGGGPETGETTMIALRLCERLIRFSGRLIDWAALYSLILLLQTLSG